jgi:hypothetical protein
MPGENGNAKPPNGSDRPDSRRDRAGLLAVGQSFTALIFWFFCIKAKEQKIEK